MQSRAVVVKSSDSDCFGLLWRHLNVRNSIKRLKGVSVLLRFPHEMKIFRLKLHLSTKSLDCGCLSDSMSASIVVIDEVRKLARTI